MYYYLTRWHNLTAAARSAVVKFVEVVRRSDIWCGVLLTFYGGQEHLFILKFFE
jgi:hypothetical protein